MLGDVATGALCGSHFDSLLAAESEATLLSSVVAPRDKWLASLSVALGGYCRGGHRLCMCRGCLEGSFPVLAGLGLHCSLCISLFAFVCSSMALPVTVVHRDTQSQKGTE